MLQNGHRCFCGNSYGRHAPVAKTECATPCPGDGLGLCGGSTYDTAVYDTALLELPWTGACICRAACYWQACSMCLALCSCERCVRVSLGEPGNLFPLTELAQILVQDVQAEGSIRFCFHLVAKTDKKELAFVFTLRATRGALQMRIEPYGTQESRSDSGSQKRTTPEYASDLRCANRTLPLLQGLVRAVGGSTTAT